MQQTLQTVLQNIKEKGCGAGKTIKANFRFATLDMIFILVFVNVFQKVFGPENSIVGVTLTILMAASMVRDLTATPVKHFLIQAATMMGMGIAAFLVTTLPPLLAFPINLAAVFLILYGYTYEYSTHMYFPYILSYLFLVFIGPVTPEQFPGRLIALAAGAVCMMLYQIFMGRNRVKDQTAEALTGLLEEVEEEIRYLLAGDGRPDTPSTVRENLCKLSQVIYDRRKKVLQISDASFCMLDAGRGFENLYLDLYQMEGDLTPERRAMLEELRIWLAGCRDYIQRRKGEVPEFAGAVADPLTGHIANTANYIRTHLIQMKQPENRRNYRKTALSFVFRLKAALDVSAVRVCYAARVALALAACTTLVQVMGLPHGKWLLFTVASVSLPYADDVKGKAKKRMIATVTGGLMAFVLFSCFPSSAARMAIMMLSGYCTFYFSDYAQTFACSTIGALGGAVSAGVYGWKGVGGMLLVRLGYVAAGILVALAVNCLIVPFSRRMATHLLWEKYKYTCGLLTEICKSEKTDTQLYYSLVVQAHLLEEKLNGNARIDGLEDMDGLLGKCQEQVRAAHRRRGEQEVAAG